MDHEENTRLENFVQKCSNLMESIQPGCVGSGGTVGEEFIAVGMADNNGSGGKFVEQEEDGEYIKYMKEVQQSEKHELNDEQVDVCGDHYDRFGNGNGHVEHEKQISNDLGVVEPKSLGVDTAIDFIKSGFEEGKETVKSDDDFSVTSNTNSPFADVEINLQGKIMPESGDDVISTIQQEEPHDQQSLITGIEVVTSNGTNILTPISPTAITYQASDDKENRNPQELHLDLQQFEQNDDDHQASPLNPDAVVFVPRFSTNPASPSSPIASCRMGRDQSAGDTIDSDADDAVVPHPNSLPRHLLEVDDDFVAQSPRKGARVYNMDAISLPGESEFDYGADCRPHELCENDEKNTEHELLKTSDTTDFQMGPETSVDLDEDIQASSINATVVEVPMKQSINMDDILNSVQPLPVDGDCLNESFSENRVPESQPDEESETLAVKELLNVEEKEFVSHSPSTEEIQMPTNSHMDSSQKDISLLPIDMDSVVNMQKSFYAEHTSSEVQQHSRASVNEESLLVDTTMPLESSLNASYLGPAGEASAIPFNILGTDETVCSSAFPPFPHSPVENKLIEKTAECSDGKTMDYETKSSINTISNGDFTDLGKRMDGLKLSNDDDNLSQVDPIVENTTPVVIDNLHPVLLNTNTSVGDLVIENMSNQSTDTLQTQHLLMASDEELPFKNEKKMEGFIDSVLTTVTDLKPTAQPEKNEHFNQNIETIQTVDLAMESQALLSKLNTKQLTDMDKYASVPVSETSGKVLEASQYPSTNPTSNESGLPKGDVNNKDVVETVATKSNLPNKSTKVEQVPANKTTTTGKKAVSARPNVGSKLTSSDVKKLTTTSSRTSATTSRKPASSAKTLTAGKPLTTSSNTGRKPGGSATLIGNKLLGSSKISTVSTATQVSISAPKPSVVTNTVSKAVRSTLSSRLSATSALPKQRPATAPVKPTTLSVLGPGTKPKISSPRSTLTSQLRKAPPTSTVTTTAKSPVKLLSSGNGSGKTTSATNSATRLKTTGGITVTTSKPIAARPVPKPMTSTSAATNITSRRLTVTSSLTATSGTMTTSMKRSPLSKPKTVVSTATGTGKLSPTKLPTDRYTGTAANKTKEFAGKRAMVPPGDAPKEQISQAQSLKISGSDTLLNEQEPSQPPEAVPQVSEEMAFGSVQQQKDISISFENGRGDVTMGENLF